DQRAEGEAGEGGEQQGDEVAGGLPGQGHAEDEPAEGEGEQRGDQGAAAEHQHLRGQQRGGPDRGGGHAPQDALFAVAGEGLRHALEAGDEHAEQDGDGDVQVDRAQSAEVRVGVAEGGDGAEDAEQQGGEEHDPEEVAGLAAEQADLGAQDGGVEEGGGHAESSSVGPDGAAAPDASGVPVRPRKASSSVAAVTSSWWAATRMRASRLMTAVPASVTRSSRCAAEARPGSAARSASSSGADGVKLMTVAPAERRMSPAGVSRAATRPRSITAIRSQSRWASSMKWVTSRTVTPPARTSSMSRQVSRRARGSSPVVSSSRTTTRGSPTRASAMDRRCC